MIGTLHATTLDCPDPLALAHFYQAVFGGTVRPDDDGNRWVDLAISDGQYLSFQRSDDFVPPVWPSDDGDQQMHLEVVVDDMDAAHTQLSAIGAERVDMQETFWVYRDPAGHLFCTFK